MDKFPRYRPKIYGIGFAAFALFMMIAGAKSMFPLNLGTAPVWAKVIVVSFLLCWYGGLLLFIGFSTRWLQNIEVDGSEIRICLGRLILRRIPLETIKTAGISAMISKHGISTLELVLSEQNYYTLSERGEKYLKRKAIRRWMHKAGVSDQGAEAAARICLFHSRKGILLRMELTGDVEEILQRRLYATRFLT